MSKASPIPLSQAQLKEILHYKPETGEFFWRRRNRKYFSDNTSFKRWNAIYPGGAAGHIDGLGYRKITIFSQDIPAHRLAWLYCYGEQPGEIDHLNRVKDDNRINNLRQVTKRENMRNLNLYKSNKSGVIGVYYKKASKKWQARINTYNGRISLGHFANFHDAVQARKEAEKIYGYMETHGRRINE